MRNKIADAQIQLNSVPVSACKLKGGAIGESCEKASGPSKRFLFALLNSLINLETRTRSEIMTKSNTMAIESCTKVLIFNKSSTCRDKAPV